MPLTITWNEIALRLALTVLAGMVIGLNRSEHGRPAGMRTTLLVCLAASLSMLQANLLMPTVGKAHDSFVVLDLMRLPLGVLSGMGFIGAGAILRKGNLVLGVTTAATLWFVTLIGLCFGGGQLALGLAGLALGLATLWGLKYAERFIHQDKQGSLTLVFGPGGPTDEEIRKSIDARFKILSWASEFRKEPQRREIQCMIEWRAAPDDTRPPSPIAEFQSHPAICGLRWQPQGTSDSAGAQQTRPTGTPIATSVE
jgi:putative Mg2+ transporter-C (MgtC) family protein